MSPDNLYQSNARMRAVTCVLLFLCLTSAQTRPVSCLLAVGEGNVVSKLSKEPELAWPGPWAVKAQAILDRHGSASASWSYSSFAHVPHVERAKPLPIFVSGRELAVATRRRPGSRASQKKERGRRPGRTGDFSIFLRVFPSSSLTLCLVIGAGLGCQVK